jgi:hypothetical protein
MLIGMQLNSYYSETMLDTTRDEIVRLSEMFEANLQNFIGEPIDPLTLHQITDLMKQYIYDVAKHAPLVYELDEVGVVVINNSGLYPWQHRHPEIIPNAYTQRIFREIVRNLS